ncbi:CD59 glycoprotein-like isoform X2 [Mixophyes fleayi]|uniref:CD59 glycoprotein-like isoform X2 n=1 Tax=Mixophyes fleayi TaxID=3061075 RepID=UPI003F4E0D9B
MTGTMNKIGSVALALGLVLLTLCSTGQALECFKCSYTSDKCETKATCGGNENACLKLTEKTTGRTKYDCRDFSRCTIAAIKEDLNVVNFNVDCCQSNLCNGSPAVLPVTALILSLVIGLLTIYSM